MIKRILFFSSISALCILLGIGAGWYSKLQSIPINVINEVTTYFVEIAGGKNKIFHLRRYGPGPGKIPRANPDVMTSMCVYDSSDAPVEISSVDWPHYWSVSLFGADGDNFFVLNDELIGDDERFTLVIDHRQKPDIKYAVKSPEPVGIMVFRRFVPSQEEAENARAHQDLTFCQSVT